MANTSLHTAKDTKNDEFYTRIEDIKDEISHYEETFRNKIVYCNCDKPEQSNFWKYFHSEFERLGLKKLTATFYGSESYKTEYIGRANPDIRTPLHGNGDFRSEECIKLLDESDIVVTNPPFSLFREYVRILMGHRKNFLIIGNINAITYKEIFPLLKDGKMWLGCRSLNKDMYFDVPDERKEWLVANKKEGSAYKIINGIVMGRLASACWYTNLDHKQRHERFSTAYKYADKNSLRPGIYPKYDDYDAIHIEKTSEIPMDYDGIMGVPITFLGKLNPVQFELVGLFNHGCDGPWDFAKAMVNGKERFKRIAIKNKNPIHP